MSLEPDSDPRHANQRHCVIFAPVVGSKDEYEQLFNDHRIDSITDFALHTKCGLLRFSSAVGADMFIHEFKGHTFKGQPIRCEIARVLPVPGAKSVKFTGFTKGQISERDLYEVMRQFGFLRRVFLQEEQAFVDFDTADEASSFLESHQNIRIGEADLLVQKMTEQDIEKSSNLGIPLSSILPREHPFWFYLQEVISEGM